MPAASIYRWLETVSAERGHRKAITFLRAGRLETELTFSQLQWDVNRFAHLLLDCGVQKGERVILLLSKSLIGVVAHFAIQAVGAAAVPLNPGFKKNELAYLLGDADASLTIVDPKTRALVRDIDPGAKLLELPTQRPYPGIDGFRSVSASAPPVDIAPGEPALIIYTSGTTGDPKGAVLTHRNLACDAGNIIKIWKMSPTDVLCHALPLFHVHGLCFALHTALLSGGHVRLLDAFEPKIVVAELTRRQEDAPCTVFMAVPAMYTKLLDYVGDWQMDFSHLRLLASGSAPLPVKEFERITRVFGREPVEREGMSETGMNFSNPLDGRRIPGSIGLPLPGLEARIVDPESGAEIAPGEVGEIWLKSDAVTPGYWRKPSETQKAFTQGWFRTGDLGRVDSDGYYYLTDRIKHIIISGGENISAKEVETVILQLDGIRESVVVGKPDSKWGEKVVAAVVLKPGSELTETDIQSHCKTHLHDWKCPKKILFLDEIPRNTMGKVLKKEVQTLFAGSSG